jgi:hypothetical protein
MQDIDLLTDTEPLFALEQRQERFLQFTIVFHIEEANPFVFVYEFRLIKTVA